MGLKYVVSAVTACINDQTEVWIKNVVCKLKYHLSSVNGDNSFLPVCKVIFYFSLQPYKIQFLNYLEGQMATVNLL
jgi:hypothetical protein